MVFASRQRAGQLLSRKLLDEEIKADLVLGLPRGGVVVAAEIARAMQLPLDVLVVRKIRHPTNREFAVGALAEGDVMLVNEQAIGDIRWARAGLEEVIAEETARLQDYIQRFHKGDPLNLNDQRVVLADDGLATGATMQVAIRSVRQQNAAAAIVVVPVASLDAVNLLSPLADELIALQIDASFDAVGRYFDHFAQVTDEEVLALLDRSG